MGGAHNHGVIILNKFQYNILETYSINGLYQFNSWDTFLGQNTPAGRKY